MLDNVRKSVIILELDLGKSTTSRQINLEGGVEATQTVTQSCRGDLEYADCIPYQKCLE